MSPSTFQSLFPQASRAQWLALVQGVLKGRDFDKALTAISADGLRVAPLYDKAQDAAPIGARAPGRPWSVIQRIDHPDAEAANTQAIEDLGNGAGGLDLVFAGAPNAHGFGLPATTEAVDAALDGVYVDAGIDLHIDAGRHAIDVARILARLVKDRRVDPGLLRVRFGLDPLGALAADGHGEPWPASAPGFAAALGQWRDLGFTGPLAAADGRVVHAAGGSPAQELAFALAAALAYLRALEDAGWPLAEAADAIAFRLAADQDQLLGVAKFRAIRLLWARVQEACGLAPQPSFVAAETAWRMRTRRDPWVNLLRDTAAVFSAGIGGADAVTVSPFTQAIGLPDAFARRLARNTQLVLIEEAHLARVGDPAAGSGAFETLTDDLAAAAWSLFQDIEARGGLFAALAEGRIQARIGRARLALRQAVARRLEPVTGVSEYPDLAETPVAVLAAEPWPAAPASQGPIRVEALAPLRLAEPFERLRDGAEQAAHQPEIFLAKLGRPADFTARAQFAKNLFEAGGIKAIDADGFACPDGGADIAALIAQFVASGARLACLCASDALYGRKAAAAAQALKAAGARAVYLAGRGGEIEPDLRAAGIDDFAFTGCDALALLAKAQAVAGA